MYIATSDDHFTNSIDYVLLGQAVVNAKAVDEYLTVVTTLNSIERRKGRGGWSISLGSISYYYYEDIRANFLTY